MSNLAKELKHKIITTLDLVDINPDEVADDASLFEGGLGLDSIDILELVVMIEQEYGVKVDNKELGEKVFRTVKTIADHIEEVKAARAAQ